MNVTVKTSGQLMLAARLVEQVPALELLLKKLHDCKKVKVREIGWQDAVVDSDGYCWRIDIEYSTFFDAEQGWLGPVKSVYEAGWAGTVNEYLTNVFMGLYPDRDIEGGLSQEFYEDDPQILIENL